MRLHEVVAKAMKGDPLGEEARRESWLENCKIVISSNSNSMEAIDEELGQYSNYSPCLADILADDWVYLGTPYDIEEFEYPEPKEVVR